MARQRRKKERMLPEDRFLSLSFGKWIPETEHEAEICEQMIEFAKHSQARTVPQFLALKEIGYSTLRHWQDYSPRIRSTYQAMVSILWCKWFDFAMDSDSLPAHQAKILDKYLNLYDEHAFEIMTNKAKEMAVSQLTAKAYAVENYQAMQLEGLYKEKYQQNESKRTKPEVIDVEAKK